MNKFQYTSILKILFWNEKGHFFFGLINVVPEGLLPPKKTKNIPTLGGGPSPFFTPAKTTRLSKKFFGQIGSICEITPQYLISRNLWDYLTWSYFFRTIWEARGGLSYQGLVSTQKFYQFFHPRAKENFPRIFFLEFVG